MSFRTPIFGKKITAKSLQAIAWLKENPTATIPEACKRFAVSYVYVLRILKRYEDVKPRCPICNQLLSFKRNRENVHRYTQEYDLYLAKLMNAVREHPNTTNEEILELVHNSLISGD